MHTIPFVDAKINELFTPAELLELADVHVPVYPEVPFSELCLMNSITGDFNAGVLLHFIHSNQFIKEEVWVCPSYEEYVDMLWMPIPKVTQYMRKLIDSDLILMLEGVESPSLSLYIRANTAKIETGINHLQEGYMAGKRLDSEEWNWLKKRVLHRHNCQCHYCGETDKVMHVDHKVPISKGGDNSFSNLVPACEDCNLRKGTKDYAAFSAEVSRYAF